MSLLVVAAIEAEAAHVPQGVPLVITGIGKTAAAVAVTRALVEHPDRATLEVVNIGTAGALRDGLDGLHEVGHVLNHDLSADAIRALGFDPQEEISLDGGRGVHLASGDLFVSDPSVRSRLAERAHLVDMEGYAIAYACRAMGVPLRMVKHVSDNADETAHDWSAAVDGSARALAGWLAANT